jgi:hypothetical protein
MANALCPQRVLKESIDLLTDLSSMNMEKLDTIERHDLLERVNNNIEEATALSANLYKAGMTWVNDKGENNSSARTSGPRRQSQQT